MSEVPTKITLPDLFTRFWAPYKSEHGAAIPRAHVKAAEAILACRTELRGVVRSVCGSCGELTVAPLSCGHRACPQCGNAAASAWRDRSAAKLLPVPHFLVTFTVPEQLRAVLRSHPEPGYAAMFAAHTSALGGTIREKLGGGGGWTSVLHTWTRELIFHPHIHRVKGLEALTRLRSPMGDVLPICFAIGIGRRAIHRIHCGPEAANLGASRGIVGIDIAQTPGHLNLLRSVS